MLKWIYEYLLSPLAYGLAAPFLLLHPKVRHGIKQRWGFLASTLEDSIKTLPPKRIWFHGASLGDLLALKPTIQHLHDEHPEYGIVITAMTNSGLSMGERQLAQYGPVLYIPYDLPGPVNRLLKIIKPEALVLEYAELWPVLVNHAKATGVKVILHNGRISTGSLYYYQFLFHFTGNLFRQLDVLLMRSADEAARVLKGGADPARVKVTGNTKYDNLQNGLAKAESRQLFQVVDGAPLLVFGSIHQPEIPLLMAMYGRLRQKFPNLALGVAPRYLEHVPLIVDEAGKNHLECLKRSGGNQPAGGKVFILDTIGELMDLYLVAAVVFVGGSFCQRGGQNILEPAICGKAVLFGPNMDNFTAEARLLHGRGGLQRTSIEQLESTITTLLNKSGELEVMGKMAKEIVITISGAAAANAKIINELILAK